MRAIEPIELSIAIPAFRSGSDSDRCISSALDQNPAIAKVVILDNNMSLDRDIPNKEALISNGVYIRNETNLGAIKNFIACWHATPSRYFTWLGDDDFISPGFTDEIANAIKMSTSNTTCWSGIPSQYNNQSGIRRSGIFFPDIASPSPIERMKQCAHFGKWNYPFYSVVDRDRVSIEPFANLVDWPASLDGFDWAWSYYLAISGRINIIPRQLYFYNTQNWIDKNVGNDFVALYRDKYLRPDMDLDFNTIESFVGMNRMLITMLLIIDGLGDLEKRKTFFESNSKCSVADILIAALEFILGRYLSACMGNSYLNKNSPDMKYIRVAVESRSLSINEFMLRVGSVYSSYLKPEFSVNAFIKDALDKISSNSINEVLVKPGVLGRWSVYYSESLHFVAVNKMRFSTLIRQPSRFAIY